MFQIHETAKCLLNDAEAVSTSHVHTSPITGYIKNDGHLVPSLCGFQSHDRHRDFHENWFVCSRL
jgi:hypothetical protein